MTITLVPEPEKPVAGQTVTIHVSVGPAATKRISLDARPNAFDPKVVVTSSADGTGTATYKVPVNRKKPIDVTAVEVDDSDLLIPGGETGRVTLTLADESSDQVSRGALDALRKQLQDADEQAAKQKQDADRLRAEVKELAQAFEQLDKSRSSYGKVSVEVKRLHTDLKKFTSARLNAPVFTAAITGEIDQWRGEKRGAITKLQEKVGGLDSKNAPTPSQSIKSIQDAAIAVEIAKQAQAKAQSAYTRVNTGLEKELVDYSKILSGLKKDIDGAVGRGDIRTEYFLLSELEEEIEKLKEQPEPDDSLDPTHVYALTPSDYETQYNSAWTGLTGAKKPVSDAEQKLLLLQKERDEAQATITNLEKTRKDEILKLIKPISTS